LRILNYLIRQAFPAVLASIATVSSLLKTRAALQLENVAPGEGSHCRIADNECHSADFARAGQVRENDQADNVLPSMAVVAATPLAR
jgi:hypothetical protein